MTAARATKLQSIVLPQLIKQVRRQLAVVRSPDQKRKLLVFWRRSNRVAALYLIAVLSGQPHVYMLAGPVTLPTRHIDDQALRARSLGDYLDNPAEPPLPAVPYRCCVNLYDIAVPTTARP